MGVVQQYKELRGKQRAAYFEQQQEFDAMFKRSDRLILDYFVLTMHGEKATVFYYLDADEIIKDGAGKFLNYHYVILYLSTNCAVPGVYREYSKNGMSFKEYIFDVVENDIFNILLPNISKPKTATIFVHSNVSDNG